MTIAIEQKIALGWPDDKIALHLEVPVGKVVGVREALDVISDVPDLFDITGTKYGGRKQKRECAKGHEMAGENVYTRPNGKRECLTCRTDRAQARGTTDEQRRRRSEYNRAYYQQRKVAA